MVVVNGSTRTGSIKEVPVFRSPEKKGKPYSSASGLSRTSDSLSRRLVFRRQDGKEEEEEEEENERENKEIFRYSSSFRAVMYVRVRRYLTRFSAFSGKIE